MDWFERNVGPEGMACFTLAAILLFGALLVGTLFVWVSSQMIELLRAIASVAS